MIEEGGLKKEDDLCDDEQVQYKSFIYWCLNMKLVSGAVQAWLKKENTEKSETLFWFDRYCFFSNLVFALSLVGWMII